MPKLTVWSHYRWVLITLRDRPWTAFLVAFTFFTLVSAPVVYGGFRLSYFAETTIGRVIRKTPEDHWTVVYAFRAGGQEFIGVTQPETGGLPAMEVIQVGAPVRVSYDPANPSISRGYDPARRFGSDYANFMFIVLSMSLAAMAIPHVLPWWPKLDPPVPQT